ncbi:hypothetical protein LINPERHAP1_LOCUS13413 [Linum perenne]
MKTLAVATVVGIILLIIPSIAFGCWYHTTNQIKKTVETNIDRLHNGLASQVEQNS